MGTARLPSVGSDYDQFEAAFKAARVPTQLLDGMGLIWVEDPPEAHRLIARFKEYPQAMRLKASDPLDVAYQQLRQARAAGDQGKIAAALEQITTLVMPAAGTVGTHLSDTQKPATKSATLPSPWRAAIRDDKGNRLP